MVRKTEEERLEEIISHIQDRRTLKIMKTVCVTATTATFTCLYKIGGYLYDRYDALAAAIKTFIEVSRNHQ